MANIASQKKRILRTERERQENRRYSQSLKTSMRHLSEVAAGDDAEATEAAFRETSSRIDRAVRSGALHRNAGARQKARAAKLRAVS